MPNYGIALFQKPEVEGLDRDDILILYGLLWPEFGIEIKQ